MITSVMDQVDTRLCRFSTSLLPFTLPLCPTPQFLSLLQAIRPLTKAKVKYSLHQITHPQRRNMDHPLAQDIRPINSLCHMAKAN